MRSIDGFPITSRGKYLCITNFCHPYCDKRGRILLHRYIAERHIKRYLLPEEIIHHNDKNTKHNNYRNLKITTIIEHNKYHLRKKNIVKLICFYCKKPFKIWKRRITKKDKHFCSISCANSYYIPLRFKKSIPHGTKNGYHYHKCRCLLCIKGKREYDRLWMRKKRSVAQ